jgi:hypothetical protein
MAEKLGASEADQRRMARALKNAAAEIRKLGTKEDDVTDIDLG